MPPFNCDKKTAHLKTLSSLLPVCAFSYAKVSKRVNIQRLKSDIWSNIRGQLPVAGGGADNEGDENSTPQLQQPKDKAPSDEKSGSAHAKQQLSFQDMILDVASEDPDGIAGMNRRRDATLPFYFICLLHLANEHVSVL
jgi:hypothetical protein